MATLTPFLYFFTNLFIKQILKNLAEVNGGLIAGIVVSILVVIILVGFVVYRKRNNKNVLPELKLSSR